MSLVAERASWTLSAQKLPRESAWIGATALPQDGIAVVLGMNGLCHAYSSRKQLWTALPRLHEPRYGCGVAFLDGSVYTMGGRTGNMRGGANLASVEKLEMMEPHGEKWTRMPDMNETRVGCAAAALNRCIVVVGGFGIDDMRAWHNSSAEVFHLDRNEWERLPDMSTRREGCAAIAMDDRVFVFGGSDGRERLCSAEYFHFSTNEWKPLPPMSMVRHYPAAVAFGNLIVVVGGQGDRGQHFDDVEVFDVNKMEWNRSHSIPKLRKGRFTHGAAFLDGVLHVVGGHNGAELDSVETIKLDPYEYMVSNLKPMLRPQVNLPMGSWAQILSVCPTNVIHFILSSDKAALDGVLLHRNQRLTEEEKYRKIGLS